MAKTFKSRVNGSTYYDKQGNPHVFLGSELTTSDEALIKELDAIVVASRGVMIYLDEDAPPDDSLAIIAAKNVELAKLAKIPLPIP